MIPDGACNGENSYKVPTHEPGGPIISPLEFAVHYGRIRRIYKVWGSKQIKPLNADLVPWKVSSDPRVPVHRKRLGGLGGIKA